MTGKLKPYVLRLAGFPGMKPDGPRLEGCRTAIDPRSGVRKGKARDTYNLIEARCLF